VSAPRKLKIARSAVTNPKVIEAPKEESPVKTSGQLVADVNAELHVGDRIEYAVTHEIDVDGEKAWVRYGVNSSLIDGESAASATVRVVKFVNTVVLRSATEVAQQILKG
jgi:hypothetical protein